MSKLENEKIVEMPRRHTGRPTHWSEFAPTQVVKYETVDLLVCLAHFFMERKLQSQHLIGEILVLHLMVRQQILHMALGVLLGIGLKLIN